jgi:hypothetical protein
MVGKVCMPPSSQWHDTVSHSALSTRAHSRYGTAMHLQGDSPSSRWFSLQQQKSGRRIYTPPGFESLGGGNFRYKLMPDPILTTPNRNPRLAQLWDDLLADPVEPRPAVTQAKTLDARFERNYVASLPLAPDREHLSMVSGPEIRVMG